MPGIYVDLAADMKTLPFRRMAREEEYMDQYKGEGSAISSSTEPKMSATARAEYWAKEFVRVNLENRVLLRMVEELRKENAKLGGE